jgi:NAD kinase
MTAGRLPRVVVVTRPTDFQALVAGHGTRAQARFFLERRGQRLEEVEERHLRFEEALLRVLQAIPLEWRRSRVTRDDLAAFVFEPADLVVPLGQDGLVANVAKYLDGQLVLGVNPDRASVDGVLVRHSPGAVAELLHEAAAGRCRVETRTMVEARLDDGQRLLALNEVFVGHRTHQSARYRISVAGRAERQSSSGLIVSTGTGATGWARSIQLQRRASVVLPRPAERKLVFFVREAFPSRTTGTDLDGGSLDAGESLEVVSEMNEDGVIFGDGVEMDRLDFAWGKTAVVAAAEERLQLVVD